MDPEPTKVPLLRSWKLDPDNGVEMQYTSGSRKELHPYSNPNLIDNTQWSNEARVATWYVVYKVVLSLIFLGSVAAYYMDVAHYFRWFIFLTNQSLLLLTIHYILDTVLVTSRWAWELLHQGQLYHKELKLSWIYKLSWVLGNVTFDLALFVTCVYFGVMYQYVLANNMLPTDLAVGLNIFAHGFNSVSCFIDTWLNRRSVKPGHLGYVYAYGLAYTIFSVVYWAVGGTGFCREEASFRNSTAVIPIPGQTAGLPVQLNSGKQCDDFIYPILDWGNQPLVAGLTIVSGMVLIPFVHLFWMVVTYIRREIYTLLQHKFRS